MKVDICFKNRHFTETSYLGAITFQENMAD